MYKFREKRILKTIFLISLMIVYLMINNTFSKYKIFIKQNGNASIAKPIIVIEKDNNINTEYSKKTGEILYFFKIKNYENENINEVEFLYNIELIENNNEFPVEYILTDLSTNEIITLENNKSKDFVIGINEKEEKSYMLKLNWKNKDVEKYSDSLQIALKTNIVQIYK